MFYTMILLRLEGMKLGQWGPLVRSTGWLLCDSSCPIASLLLSMVIIILLLLGASEWLMIS